MISLKVGITFLFCGLIAPAMAVKQGEESNRKVERKHRIDEWV